MILGLRSRIFCTILRLRSRIFNEKEEVEPVNKTSRVEPLPSVFGGLGLEELGDIQRVDEGGGSVSWRRSGTFLHVQCKALWDEHVKPSL